MPLVRSQRTHNLGEWSQRLGAEVVFTVPAKYEAPPNRRISYKFFDEP